MRPSRVDPRARTDIADAALWYESHQNGLGLAFLAELDAAIARICRGPFRFAIISGELRRARLHRFPYIVYFTLEEDVIVVLACLHGRRSPAVWKSRV